MIAVPDASAAFEYLANTTSGKKLSSILDGAELVAPSVLDLEILSVTRRAVLQGSVSAERGKRLLMMLSRWNVARLPVDQMTVEAFRLRDNFSAADALYVLTARAVKGMLVTCDARLARAPVLDVPVHLVSPAS